MSDQNQKDPQQKSPTQDAIKAPVLPAATEPSISTLESMLKILMQREIRATEKEAAEEARIAARAAQRRKSGEGSNINQILKQKNCPHRKGGKLLGAQIDHCVGMHTFIDRTMQITCHRCGMIWRRFNTHIDTREFLYVENGQEIIAIPNHTGLSWNDAVLMMTQSTNKPTSSEIPNPAMQQAIQEMGNAMSARAEAAPKI